jgi:uncharacterized protein
MKIKNVILCKSNWSKARGLMFSKRKNLLFVFDNERRISLHNCFVFFPIDLIFLDKDFRVIEIKRDFRPFRFYTSKKKTKYVLELTEEHKIKIGDKIKL